jgi:hypothetical protein
VGSVDPNWQETAYNLRTSGSVVLDSTGAGVIMFDTDSANTRWEVDNVVVSTNQAATATTIPVVNLALNTVTYAGLTDDNKRGATYSGNQDQWSGGIIDVGHCDYLSVVFSPPPGASGAPLSGVLAKAVVTGTKYTRRS